MSCENTKECICPKESCPRHKKCCECIVNHRETDSLPFCMFPDNDGDKSLESYYRKKISLVDETQMARYSNLTPHPFTVMMNHSHPTAAQRIAAPEE